MKQTTKIANQAFRESERKKWVYIKSDMWTRFKFWILDLLRKQDENKIQYYYEVKD